MSQLLFKLNRPVCSIRSMSTTFNGITYGPRGKHYHICLDRPERYNAFTREMYGQLGEALKAADADPQSKFTVLTGNGKFYTSGNDLSNLKDIKSKEEMKLESDKIINTVAETIRLIIDHGKPLIALVQGPAIGFGVTTLAMCDMVVASDKSTFQTPFSMLGYCAESCSTYTFPRIMGNAKAAEMLIFGKTLTAQEAYSCGLVSRLIEHDKFAEETDKLLKSLEDLPPKALQINKQLLRKWTKDKLHEVNDQEIEVEKTCWTSDESMKQIANFFKRQNKL